jgi:hypothetical protein
LARNARSTLQQAIEPAREMAEDAQERIQRGWDQTRDWYTEKPMWQRILYGVLAVTIVGFVLMAVFFSMSERMAPQRERARGLMVRARNRVRTRARRVRRVASRTGRGAEAVENLAETLEEGTRRAGRRRRELTATPE